MLIHESNAAVRDCGSSQSGFGVIFSFLLPIPSNERSKVSRSPVAFSSERVDYGYDDNNLIDTVFHVHTQSKDRGRTEHLQSVPLSEDVIFYFSFVTCHRTTLCIRLCLLNSFFWDIGACLRRGKRSGQGL